MGLLDIFQWACKTDRAAIVGLGRARHGRRSRMPLLGPSGPLQRAEGSRAVGRCKTPRQPGTAHSGAPEGGASAGFGRILSRGPPFGGWKGEWRIIKK